MRNTVDQKTQHLVALGDESALDRLCTVYGPRVLWLVRLRMGKELRSKLESVDLVQDVFISALKDLGNFTYRNEGDFVRWLARITENRLRDNLDKLHADKRDIRKEVRLNTHKPTIEDSFAAALEPIDATTPSVIISKREEFDQLAKAIDKLKPEYREVIVLTKVEGLSYSQIGDKLGRSADAARMLFSRAMAALTGAFEVV
ncbi:MAG: sigma-70 family RNA polymerase sigma factor [Planctomycetota bacterium]|jgi:RNA polymerase sigma-70 factor (ECF subfamily)